MKKNFGKIVVSLIISIAFFITLLMIEKTILTPNGTTKILIATQNIEKNTVLTSQKIDELFKVKEVDTELRLENSILEIEKEKIKDTILAKDIEKGEIISSNSLINKESILSNLNDPIELSFKVADISQGVGGTIREGDMINISIINDISKENEPVFENVYVNKALTSDGKEVKRGDSIATATVNIIISKNDESELNKALGLGTIRVSRAK